MPYHKLGVSKAARIGIESEELEMPSNETVAGTGKIISGAGRTPGPMQIERRKNDEGFDKNQFCKRN
ncbi:MAG: hypothetical protein V8Q27_10295 [Eubacteriales bacterium]